MSRGHALLLHYSTAFTFTSRQIIHQNEIRMGMQLGPTTVKKSGEKAQQRRWCPKLALINSGKHFIKFIKESNMLRDGCKHPSVTIQCVLGNKHLETLELTSRFQKHRLLITLKPLSHRIVRLLDRTIGCYLANVRPIGNVCYDRQKRSHTAIGLSSWW